MADKKTSKKSRYTEPKLRERLKEKIKRGTKGGAAQQWSARKSQLLATEYKKAGGGYTTSKSSDQKSLDQWTREDWQTSNGEGTARGKSGTKRYLPKKAWEKLSDAEKEATDKRKRAGSKAGKQYVSNTANAKKARKKAVSSQKSASRTPSRPAKSTATKKKVPSRKKPGKASAGSPATTFKKGDHVEWTKIGGSTTGKVIRKITADTTVHGHKVRASRKNPQYEVATDATGKRAAHKPDKMKKA